ATAASTSEESPAGTRASSSPVAGFTTSIRAEEAGSRHDPSMKCPYSRGAATVKKPFPTG
ncbi:MAG: hypothetical protein H6Q79_2358, partial [Deltaproteobacteria bacterium]|nr:hypothetical protein [Deltaproteobacteria bacterium]